MSIPKEFQNLVFDNASAADLQQAQPTRKRAICKHMVDGRGCKGGDASAVKNQILKLLGYKRFSHLAAFFGLCLTSAYGDGGNSETAAVEVVSAIEAVEIQPVELTPTSATEEALAPTTIAAPVVVEQPFSPFTGKIKRQKVRLRASADLESPIVRELHKGEMLVVNGKKGDFYAVDPPAGTKAYVFRSFVLDGVVEGNRVNVRFAPSLDAPVIGHLNSGDRIQGQISSLNNKWYEITPPPGTRFYVAKEFVESIGGP
ncbi:MAG TPA: hypothetical protein VFU89_00630, partial [Rhabdochlamydiaceae bacterium]|nr:hypothetical protein [Rhabdochlamydiaceae bacterium]